MMARKPATKVEAYFAKLMEQFGTTPLLQADRRVDAEPITEAHGLAQQPDLRGEQRVVDQFDALARTDRTHMKDGIAVAGQHRTDSFDGIVGPAHE